MIIYVFKINKISVNRLLFCVNRYNQFMQKEITITIKPEEENNQNLYKKLVKIELKKQNILLPKNQDEINLVFVKKSIDARHGQQKIHLRFKVFIGEKPTAEEIDGRNFVPEWKKADGKKSVIVVGSGPAGLFGALKLLESGIKPIIIERGKNTKERRQDIALISTKSKVDSDSNYCFGEGGAGTFSDGKLYTRSNKRGNINSVLQIFAFFGADQKILTDAHPHIGTDKLPQIINNMRNKIIELGGEFLFEERLVDFILEEKNGSKEIKGVKIQNTQTGKKIEIFADAVLLATGHSANDIYTLIASKAPAALEAKTFAAGVRVEHPRELIDSIQFHGNAKPELGAAEYRVTTQIDGRGVYSFCMCPGGFVVPSATSADGIVVNGMSAAKRNSKWSNAAIVVEIRPEDVPQKFVKMAEDAGCSQLAGLFFRTEIENLAAKNGDGQSAPAQRLTDFLEGRKSETLPQSSYTAGLVSSELDKWLPKHISERLKSGFKEINKNMHGFICDDALMIAPETRTSTPVRILRDKENCQCIAIKKLYPAGEGSGYSGGIVSSAMDGIKCCSEIAKIL